MQGNNYEPRRTWRRYGKGVARRCASCGARAALHTDLPFCAACTEWSRERNLAEWDDLGAGD